MIFYIFYFFLSTVLFFLLQVAKPFNKKIRLHLNQEKDSIRNVAYLISKVDRKVKKILLFHAASAGEYEQLKPILKRLNRDRHFIVQSFTSPTVYEAELYSGLVDVCCYHPFDVWWKSYAFFNSIKPDIYCKGSDYKNISDDITGKIVEENEAGATCQKNNRCVSTM